MPGRRSSSPSLNRSSSSSERNDYGKYVPSHPSQLREAHMPPPTPQSEVVMSPGDLQEGEGAQAVKDADYFQGMGNHDFQQDAAGQHENGNGSGHGHDKRTVDPYSWDQASIFSALEGPGTPGLPFVYPATNEGIGADSTEDPRAPASGWLGRLVERMDIGLSLRSSKWLANRHNIRHPWMMYLYYYVPFFNWIRQYHAGYLFGDLIAAATMASFYIPMSLSYASNLAHIPAINGLYAFAVNPIIYAVFGTCPQMVVGPEAAGSLLTGSIVRDSISKGKVGDEDGAVLASIAGVVTGFAGAILLIAGFFRVGFLDNVLSRPFLRGFISAIGFVIVVDQLIPQLGLSMRASEVGGISHGSCIDKIVFLWRNIGLAHGLTAAVSFGSFAVIMVCREIKRQLQPRYLTVAYIPDRFLIVVLMTILCWQLRWDQRGLPILGDVQAGSGHKFRAENPFDISKLRHTESALSSSFVIALLGFFESSVAAKSLGANPADGIQGVALSANRELVALGVANVVGGIFMAIPAFGGYGRSKVNSSTGGKTPMSSIFLSLITLICIFFALPAFYYIPRGVLSAMISVVAWSLIEEAPHDILFFWRISGWSELALILIVFVSTILWSLEVGIACGIGFSLLRVIKHATRPRIQIIGRTRGTDDHFENAEADPERVELIDGCLIVKIPEPLTFANTGDLRNRLNRLMEYGTNQAHPALPRMRDQHHNKNIIFDVHGVTSLDGAGAQVLSEICQSYKDKGVRIIFCRVPSPRSKVGRLYQKSGIVDICGGQRHFVKGVREAIELSEVEEVVDAFRDDPDVGGS